MAKHENYEQLSVQLSVQERQNRYFSEEFKRKKVSEIERNLCRVSQVCREYQVSPAAVYRWIYKYSVMRKKSEKQVIETQSDTRKLLYLQEQVGELQRIIGEKQLKLDFMEKLIELAEQEYGIDIKKKYTARR